MSGNEKYNLVRNAIAISLYLNSKKISREAVDNEIKKRFGLKDINVLKNNLIVKKSFLKEYKLMYDKLFAKILLGIKNGSK